jgi:hypothetical protein
LGSTEEGLEELVSAEPFLKEVVDPPGYRDGETYLLDGPLRLPAPPPLKSITSPPLEDSVKDLSLEPDPIGGAPLEIAVELKGSSGPHDMSASFFLAKKCHAPKRKRMKKNTGLVHVIVLDSPLKIGRLERYIRTCPSPRPRTRSFSESLASNGITIPFWASRSVDR